MLLKRQIHEILTILSNNLQQSSPQLVASSFIAEQMRLDLSTLKNSLKVMKGMGVI